VFFLLIIIFASIAFHEYSHGWVAYKLGDPTPKLCGRLTLNPIAHIDPFGTIILPFILLLIPGLFPIGYAKPVPINPYYFKNPKKDMMWVGIAGPLSNFFIAFFLMVIFKIVNFGFSEILIWAIMFNIILGLFNLIPIPPLDGSRIVAAFLPYKLSYNYLKMGFMGFFLVIILINFLIMSGFFQSFISFLERWIISTLGMR
jgi:Zn-dependent protease